MKITMMKAGYGDCFLIETKKNDGLPYNILVDGGTGDSYDGREKNRDYFFPYLRENKIDLMILTHIDDDHIKGIQRLFKDLLKKKHLYYHYSFFALLFAVSHMASLNIML